MTFHQSGEKRSAIKIYGRLKPLFNQSAPYELDFDPETGDEYLQLTVKSHSEDYVNNRPEQYNFKFSKIFNIDTKQEKVFEVVAKPVIDSAFEGYNGTIFAYGQTGSGKTYTMTGRNDGLHHRGIIPRTLSYIFNKFMEDRDGKIQGAFISYLEIYNECGYDLLNSSLSPSRLEDMAKVGLLEDGHSQLHLRNLSVHQINSEEEALQLLYLGDHNRTIAETPQNEASTRSHCIFTIHINTRETSSSVVRRSKIHLVDLAGSERVLSTSSTTNGQLFSETRHINLALHYLEQVIVALGDSSRCHIPYRNSMMTSVLRDSLGGNCMTSMIATLSMDQKNVMESLSTCRFSQRVALVTNNAVPNEEQDPAMVIAQQKMEIRRLKEALAHCNVKPIRELSSPLSKEEYSDCSVIVDRFLNDSDPNASLTISPDMRLIQCCFSLLKQRASGKRLSKPLSNFGGDRSSNQIVTLFKQPSALSSIGGENKEELLKTIALRDQEIKVLGDLLKKEKQKRSEMNSDSSLPPSRTLTRVSQSQSQPTDVHHPLRSTSSKSADSRPRSRASSKPVRAPPTPDPAILRRSMSRPASSGHSSKSSPKSKGLEAFEKKLSPEQKIAFNAFKRAYPGYPLIDRQINYMNMKRQEIRSIKDSIKHNKVNLESNKMVVGNSDGVERMANGEIKDLVEALNSLEKTIDIQKGRLKDSEGQLEDSQALLKSLFEKLASDFDKFWIASLSNKKPAEIGKLPISDAASSMSKLDEVETKSVASSSKPPKNVPPTSDDHGLRYFRHQSNNFNADADLNSMISSGPSQIDRRMQDPQWKGIHRPPKTPPATPAVSSPSEAILQSRGDQLGMLTEITEDEEDDNPLQIPLTGEVEIDKEILQFLETRKKVYKTLKQQKTMSSTSNS